MESDDLLRLAWEADHDGRRTLRDALLTLAVVESGPDDAWAEVARARLVARRSYHFLAGFPSVAIAVQDPRIIDWAARARIKYPPGRVRWMLLRSRATRGTYTGRVESFRSILDDLFGMPAEAENVRADVAQVVRGPIARNRAIRPVAARSGVMDYRPWEPTEVTPEAEDPAKFARFYLTVLLAIAVLLTIVREPAGSAHP